MNNSEVMKHHPLGLAVSKSNDYKEWSWADKQFMNFFICHHIQVLYKEEHEFDPTFYPIDYWDQIREVNFKCIPMTWTTKWLRVIFVAPSSKPKIANFESNSTVMDYCRKEFGSYLLTDKGYVMQQK